MSAEGNTWCASGESVVVQVIRNHRRDPRLKGRGVRDDDFTSKLKAMVSGVAVLEHHTIQTIRAREGSEFENSLHDAVHKYLNYLKTPMHSRNMPCKTPLTYGPHVFVLTSETRDMQRMLRYDDKTLMYGPSAWVVDELRALTSDANHK